MKLRILTVAISLAGSFPVLCQSTLSKQCSFVLSQNIPDSAFLFDNSTGTDGLLITVLKYLGAAKTDKGRVLKILTYKFTWGPNHHTSAKIYIFSDKDEYIGVYNLGGESDLPYKLTGTSLRFRSSWFDRCTNRSSKRVNLRNGLPKTIFIACHQTFGDIYTLSTEKF